MFSLNPSGILVCFLVNIRLSLCMMVMLHSWVSVKRSDDYGTALRRETKQRAVRDATKG
jgi:hypothetical protein